MTIKLDTNMKTKNAIAKTTNAKTLAGSFRTACAERLLLPLLLTLALPAAVQAQFDYTTNNGTITITKYTGSDSAVTIPSTTNGLPVTGIGFWAFYSCTSPTNITIPNSVTNIGAGAFSYCTNLSAITVDPTNSFYSSVDGVLFDKSQTMLIQCPGGTVGSYIVPSGVTSIGSYGFSGCTSLTSVTLPNSVTSIMHHAFYYCTSLTGAYFQGNAPSVGSSVFYGANKTVVYYLPGTTGWGATFGGRPAVMLSPPVPYTYTTNSGTITITGYTGPGGDVTIPDKIEGLPVTGIGDSAFNYSTNLTGLTIPDSVTSIGEVAFGRCFSLASVTIGSNVTTIGAWAFRECTSLASVTIPDGVASLAPYTFYYCSSLASVTIGSSVTNLGSSAFLYCASLTNIAIPSSVTSIGFQTFWECASLTSVTIPNSVTTIEEAAFSGCHSLLSVTLPNGVTNIAKETFRNCTSLTNITMPGSVTTIGDMAFYDCASLPSVLIPSSVTTIGNLVFSGCFMLTTITVDASNPVYSSVDGVLFNKSRTTLVRCPEGKAGSYSLPNSVTTIENEAFASCASLASLTIGNSLTGIGYRAFYSCTNLLEVYFKGNAPTADSSVFDSDINATVYYLPGTTGWGTMFGGRPTVLWNPQVPTSDASFGVLTNRFGFTITGSSNLVIVVEACANLAHPIWSPVGTNTLTGGSSYFSDPQWTNYLGRFYRLRSP